jgi:hypothetical protein
MVQETALQKLCRLRGDSLLHMLQVEDETAAKKTTDAYSARCKVVTASIATMAHY